MFQNVRPGRMRVFILLILLTGLTWAVRGGYAFVYDIVFLDTFDRAGGRAYRINDANQIIGEVSGGPLPVVAAFWDLNGIAGDGETHLIDDAFDAPMSCSLVYGISENGWVVGAYLPFPKNNHRPFIYNVHSRTWQDLGTPADDEDELPHQDDQESWYTGYALAVNSAGHALGVAWKEIMPSLPLRLTYWSGVDAPVEAYTEPVQKIDWFFDLNEHNESAGYFNDRAFRGNGAGIAFLPMPGGFSDYSAAYGINESGLVVGFARHPGLDGLDRPVLWTPGYAPLVLETYNHPGTAYSINDQGDIVGTIDGGAVLWTWDGVHYQPIDLSRYVRPLGTTIRVALDINNQGWIVGWARYGVEGVERPVALVPRIDETPPTARLEEGEPDTGSTTYEFTVIYEDNGIIEESTIDDSDLTVSGPNGYQAAATRVSVGDAEYAAAEDRWYWPVTYRIPAPGGLWDDDDVGDYTVAMNREEVADRADYHVAEGEFGTFPFTARTLDVWMESGTLYTGDDPLPTESYGVSIDTAILADLFLPVQNVWIRTPTGAEYFLTDINDGFWSLSATSQASLTDFSDGWYSLFLDFGSQLVVEKEFWFGIPDTTDPLPQPQESPAFITPVHGADHVPVSAGFAWTAPTDPTVNSVRLVVEDTTTGLPVDSIRLPDIQTTHWPYIPLLASHAYRAELTFRHGYYDQLVDAWAFSGSKYTARIITFATADPDPATYTPGDLDGGGAFHATSLVVLQQYLAGNIVHGVTPFTQPLLAADLNGDGLVNSTDLVLLADGIAEN